MSDKPMTVEVLMRTLQTMLDTGVSPDTPVVIDTEDVYGRSKEIGSLCMEHSVRLSDQWVFTGRRDTCPDGCDGKSVVSIRPVRD